MDLRPRAAHRRGVREPREAGRRPRATFVLEKRADCVLPRLAVGQVSVAAVAAEERAGSVKTSIYLKTEGGKLRIVKHFFFCKTSVCFVTSFHCCALYMSLIV